MSYTDAELTIQLAVLSEDDWREFALAQRRIRMLRTDWEDTKTCVATQNRRAKKLGLTSTVTLVEWEVVLAKHGYKCAECGEEHWLEMDHIVPISKGGQHVQANVQPLCRDCNGIKGNRISVSL